MARAGDDGGGVAEAPSSVESSGGTPSETETYVLSLGALAAGIMTLLFDDQGICTVLLITVALIPWALLVGGVRLPTWLFVVWVMVPASVMILLEQAGGPLFLGIMVVTRIFSMSRSWYVLTAVTLAALSMTALLWMSEAAEEDAPVGFHEVGAHYFATGVAVCACCGYLFRRQRELGAQLRWSRQRLDAAAAAEERRRIAREVHDVVAHSLTVVLLNVTGARKALANQPDLAAEALDRAESVGRESLDGIRRVVGLLRDSDESVAGEAAPQPTGAELPALVDQQRAAGAIITTEITGDLASLDPLTGAAVVRVVQEALTNAQRHAPGAPVDLRVAVDVGLVVVTVRNGPARGRDLDASTSRRGLGLVGMRERVEGLGGQFSAGPVGDGWQVKAVIPASSPSSGAVSPSAEGDAEHDGMLGR